MKIYPKGHLLCVNHGIYEHIGISDGYGNVYENAHRTGGRGKVALKDFSKGKKIIDIGILPGSVEPDKIIEKAETLVADKKKYNILFNNCEHFVREVCGVDVKTPQIQHAIFFAVSSAVALRAKDTRLKGIAAGAAIGTLLSKSSRSVIKTSLTGASFGLLIGLALRYRKSRKKRLKR